MDKATLIGIGGGCGIIVLANVMEGGNPASLFLLPPLLLVFGATLCVTLAGGTMSDAKASMRALKRAFAAKVIPAAEVVPTVVDLADKARREGLLALEDAVRNV